MRGETFVLTRDQIEFDSPNYFSTCFLGEFAESRTRTLTLSRDPELFGIILDHLSGYEVLPLHSSAIPKRMSQELALHNLLVDARFYLLDGLSQRISSTTQSLNSTSAVSPPVSYVMFRSVQNTWGSLFWGSPVPVSQDTAKSLKEKHGLEFNSNLMPVVDQTSIERVLLDASMEKPFTVEAAWTGAPEAVEFDSPNYFTSCFFGEFSEARTRTVTLLRDPELFKITLDYLSGYDVLPLHESVIPRRMSSDVALRNVLTDAQFYQLDGLIDRINQDIRAAEEAR
ncbi:hypothetical protein FRC12_019293 [Ceratobasidium sp. 428]|nr:hypothetical protein FRC12_019293 [Ceratobasidium sp. 428]